MLGVVQKLSRGILGVKILMPVISEADIDSDEEWDRSRATGVSEDVTSSCVTGASEEKETSRGRHKRERRAAHRERMRALMGALNEPKTCWHVCRVMGLTTLHREFQVRFPPWALVPPGNSAALRTQQGSRAGVGSSCPRPDREWTITSQARAESCWLSAVYTPSSRPSQRGR